MVYKKDLRSKDFSIELSVIINKLSAIADLTTYNDNDALDDSVDHHVMHGLGAIIQDAVDDLRLINNALYPGSKVFCPED